MGTGAAEQRDLRNQVGLELVQIDIETSIESKGGSDTRNDLGDDPVEVLESRRVNS